MTTAFACSLRGWEQGGAGLVVIEDEDCMVGGYSAGM